MLLRIAQNAHTLRNMHSKADTQELVTLIENGLRGSSIPVGDFCKAAKIDRATWQRWKAGRHSPHPSMKPGIIAAFEALVAKSGETKAA